MGDVAKDKTIQIGQDFVTKIEEIHPETDILGSSVLLCATTLGAGILAIPHTVNLLGIYVGLSTIAFFGICTAYSIYLLLVGGKKANVKSYEGLMEAAFPKVGKILTTIFLNVLIFGGLTGFFVIIGDSVDGVMQFFIEGDTPKKIRLGIIKEVRVGHFCEWPLTLHGNRSTKKEPEKLTHKATRQFNKNEIPLKP